MRLYTFVFSPNPLKVRLALAELGVEYEPVEIHLFKGEHRSDAFSRVNPHRKVPVLEEGDLVLRESNAIIAHLGRSRGGGMWPEHPAGEAIALQWLFFEAVHLATPCGTVWWNDVACKAAGRPGNEEAVVKDATSEVERSLDLLEPELKERAFMLGETMSLVDCSIAVAIAMLRGTRLDRADRWPSLTAYRDRIRDRASWAAARGDAIHEFR
jgi:glutathione S-transferase